MASIRKLVFAEDHIYHVYNRGVERRNIFLTNSDFRRFFQLLSYYRYRDISQRFSHAGARKRHKISLSPVARESRQLEVEILAWCLLPNHFHLMLRQVNPEGIRTFMGKVSNSYTKYFNERNNRSGYLFQGPFKAVIVETDEQLIHLSRYIHLNPVVSSLVHINQLQAYHWSSYPEYVDDVPGFTEKRTVLDHFSSEFEYKVFVRDQSEYAAELAKVKHLSLEA